MNTEKKGRFLHHEWAEKFVSGIDIQFDLEVGGDGWSDVGENSSFRLFVDPDYKFRIKPQTMQIGLRTINKPISVKPAIETFVFVSDATHEDKYFRIKWADSNNANFLLNRNLCHLTAEDAIKHCDAILSLMK